MSVATAYGLFAGLLAAVLAVFIAIPASTRWVHNLVLARKGVKATGRYQGDCLVAFDLPDGQHLFFSTWRVPARRWSIGEVLPVLYDPERPGRAEVMKGSVLWIEPLGNLSLALAYAIAAVLIFCNVNPFIALAIGIVSYLPVFLAMVLALYTFYPASRLRRFADQPHESLLVTPPPSPTPPDPPVEALVELSPVPRGRAARRQLLEDMSHSS